MECSSCGAYIESGHDQCSQCSAGTGSESLDSLAGSEPAEPAQKVSKLIEFPGVSRSTVPQWRKELSERVREVQEKRAREESLELTAGKEKLGRASEEVPQLELLPQQEAAPVNPLVVAALRRIERAHETPAYVSHSSHSSNAAIAYSAPMMHDQTSPATALGAAVPDYVAPEPELEPEPEPVEKTHNLSVVPTQAPGEAANSIKPRRMIGDINDPALNYLDSVRTTVRFETSNHRRASIPARFISALVDITVVGLLSSPFAAALELLNANWQSPPTWIIAGSIFCIVGFFYFTISTALTGRTVGLKLFALRIVDIRTGLIPTGAQSASRSLIYLASLLILGITSIFALFNPEHLTAHDRITRTAVVQA